MGTHTKNLNLYKADPVADANKTFNITTMLNENWDKVDAKLEETFDTIMEEYGYSFQTIREPELNKKTITVTPGAGYKGTASLVAVFEKDERGNTVVNVTETIGAKVSKHKHTVGGGAGKGEVVNG